VGIEFDIDGNAVSGVNKAFSNFMVTGFFLSLNSRMTLIRKEVF